MTAPQLPLPQDLANDLHTVVTSLDRYKAATLPALRIMPSVRLWKPPPNQTSGEEDLSTTALRMRICAAIARFAYANEQDALEALLDFNHPDTVLKDRQDTAAKYLGTTADSLRKGRQQRLLRQLADNLYRGELEWLVGELSAASQHAGSPWYRVLHLERSVTIDETDPREQIWYSRFVLKAVRPGQAIFTTMQGWTGDGKTQAAREPGDVEVLSARTRNDGSDLGYEHKLIQVRPESDSAEARTLYVWDLGALVVADQEVELIYRQHLVDEAGTFKPFIGFATDVHPELTTIRLRAKLPDKVAPRAAVGLALEVEPTNATSRTASYAAQPIAVRSRKSISVRDDDGFFTYEPDLTHLADRYELRWGADAP